MNGSFLILHKGKRTGGTAVTQALGEVDALHVLFDPLHQSIHLPFDDLAAFTSDDWRSHHPQGYAYFASYRPLLQDGRIPGVPADVFADYHLTEHDSAEPLFQYLDGLIAAVRKRGTVPVLAMETSEARIAWLRHRFPQAVQVGVVRDRDAQLASWLQQGAYGDFAFFDLARDLIEANPGWFGGPRFARPTQELSADDLVAMFDCYREAVGGALYREADAVLDIADLVTDPRALLAPLGLATEQNVRRFVDFLGRNPNPDRSSPRRLSAIVEHQGVLRRQRDEMCAERDALRVQLEAELAAVRSEADDMRTQRDAALTRERALEAELAAVRSEADDLRTQRDAALTRERALAAERDAILTSRSWRYTAWLRDLAATRPAAR